MGQEGRFGLFNMMEYNVVNLGFFNGRQGAYSRLDAEYALPSLVEPELSICAKKHANTGSVTSQYDGPSISDKYKPEGEKCFYISIDSIDTDDGLTYREGILYKDRPSRAKYVLQNQDILVSNVRPNRGGIALITARNNETLASSGFTLLRQSPAAPISQGFLFAFLKTETAKNQLIRRNRGSMYPAVLSDDVFDVRVPLPPKKFERYINELIQKGVQSHDEFFRHRQRQDEMLQEMLLSKIGKPPPSPLDTELAGANFSIQSSELFFAPGGPQRFDGEFFRKEYQDFYSRLEKVPSILRVGDAFTTSTGRNQGKPVEDIPYLRQSILTNAGINWSAATIEPGDRNPETGRVKTNDILMACTAHEIYYVARKVDFVRSVPKDFHANNCCVADIMILRPKPSKPSNLYGSYVAAFLRSPWGLHQVQRCIRGLRGGHVYGADVERFVKLFVPENDWLDRFETEAFEAEERRLKGKQVLCDAISRVSEWAETLRPKMRPATGP